MGCVRSKVCRQEKTCMPLCLYRLIVIRTDRTTTRLRGHITDDVITATQAAKQKGHNAGDQKKAAAVALKITCSVCKLALMNAQMYKVGTAPRHNSLQALPHNRRRSTCSGGGKLPVLVFVVSSDNPRKYSIVMCDAFAVAASAVCLEPNAA